MRVENPMSDNAPNNEREPNRWRFSLRTLLIAVTMLAVAIGAAYAIHRRILFSDVEVEYITRVISSKRNWIYHVFSPIFSLFAFVGICGIWYAIVNRKEKGAVITGIAIAFPPAWSAISCLLWLGMNGQIAGLQIMCVLLLLTVRRTSSDPHLTRAICALIINFAWFAVLLVYGHMCGQFAD